LWNDQSGLSPVAELATAEPCDSGYLLAAEYALLHIYPLPGRA